MSTYAWMITKDSLADNDSESAVGVQGPRDASDAMIAHLEAGKGHTFRMYDGDGELYYTGRATWDADAEGSEEACYGPLGDFGGPGAGCAEIRWHGHREWDCG